MTWTPQPITGWSNSGGAANRSAYVSLPRKYRPLTNMNTSPIISPRRDRSSSATGHCAFGDMTIFARGPPQLAGDNKKMRDGGAVTEDKTDIQLEVRRRGEG